MSPYDVDEISRHPKYKLWAGVHILSAAQFARDDLDHLIRLGHTMRVHVHNHGCIDVLSNKLLAIICYEPSSRTSFSFQAAMLRLGGKVMLVGDVACSSVAKGETLKDTVRCLQSYADAIVLRHPSVGSAAEAASVLNVPLVNAGDGIGEHPTQALSDLLTIHTRFGRIDDLNVTFVGDLLYGRTVHSLAQMLQHYNVRVNFVSPKFLRCPTCVVASLRANNVNVAESEALDAVLPETDVLYVTRVQKERFTDHSAYESAQRDYCVTPELLTNAKQTMVVMHPLPRTTELDQRVDDNPQAVYFDQMKDGLYMRMALLAAVFGEM